MFAIDLLKGQGIPIKSRPEGIAVAVGTFAVPLVIILVMLGCYLHTRIVISIQKQTIANYEARISELSDAVMLQNEFEEEKRIISSSLSEVKTAVGRYIQWSPILVTLVKNMPHSVVLTELDVKQNSVKRKVPQKDRPGRMVDISVPARTLRMNVSTRAGSNCDRAVRNFRDHLRFSSLLGPKLEDIQVSQETDLLEGRDVVLYEIDCAFKPRL